jgi:L-Ala-D/L-Glu epimerase
MNRRAFTLTTTSLLTTAVAASGISSALFSDTALQAAERSSPGTGKLTLSHKPYTLELKHPFGVSVSTRTTTPVVLTSIEYNGTIGYGEASMPPYLGESQESVATFLAKVDLRKYDNPFQLGSILADIDAIETGNTAAKAAVDIAMHDLVGKLMGQPLYNIWGLDKAKTPNTVFTIGIDTPDVVRQKTKEVDAQFKLLKVKMGRDQASDKAIVEAIRSVTDKPLTTDANQGWKDKQYALDMIHWLKEKGAVLIEQPLPKEMVDENAWITERSPIPVIADESIKRLSDLIKMKGVYTGVNLKLMKTTGLREARTMIDVARAQGMKVMIGCMTETSCGITAAAHLTPLVDWADLDGALLIKNDCYNGMTVVDGKITLPDRPGTGVVPV